MILHFLILLSFSGMSWASGDAERDIQCELVGVYESPRMRTSGKTLHQAQEKLQVLCLEDQCQKIGQRIQEAMNLLRSLPEEELRNFLEFAGKSPEEIEFIITHKMNGPDVSNKTCLSATPAEKQFVFNSCMSSPMNCQPH